MRVSLLTEHTRMANRITRTWGWQGPSTYQWWFLLNLWGSFGMLPESGQMDSTILNCFFWFVFCFYCESTKSQLTGKDPDAGKDWGHEEKRETEEEMVGWHHWLDGHEFEQTPEDSEGQGSLACCSPWVHKESNVTEGLNNSNQEFYADVLASYSFPRGNVFCLVPRVII